MTPPVLPNDIEVRLLTSTEMDHAVGLIADVFSQSEPLAIASGQTRAELVAMLQAMGPSALSEKLSFAGWINDTIVGVSLATVFTWQPPEGAGLLSPNFRPIGAMLAELEAEFEARPREVHENTVHIHMLAVHGDHQGHGVADAVVRACVRNAAENEFGRVVTDATNPISQRVFHKCGFKLQSEIRYDRFAFEGRHVFADIPNAESTQFMSKEF